MSDPSLAAGLDPSILAAETDRLLDFGRHFPHPDGGSYWLDGTGQPDVDRAVFTYITARMAHVYALGGGLGRPADARLADEALRGLSGRLHDDKHGGWFAAMNPDGSIDDDKACYTHAFVVLAAASGSLAQRPDAPQLLQDSLAIWQERFFEPSAGLFVDAWDRSFTTLDSYRGANANMHAVEALLAAADATADAGVARSGRWGSLGASWWNSPSRTSGGSRSTSPPTGSRCWSIIATSRTIPSSPTGRRLATAWNGRGCCCISRRPSPRRLRIGCSRPRSPCSSVPSPTVGPSTAGRASSTRPIGTVRRSSATACTGSPPRPSPPPAPCTGGRARPASLTLARTWWGFAEEYHIDRERGSWIHQLDAENRPADSVWPGKPDLYHAVQATLLPRYPLAPCLGAVLNS